MSDIAKLHARIQRLKRKPKVIRVPKQVRWRLVLELTALSRQVGPDELAWLRVFPYQGVVRVCGVEVVT